MEENEGKENENEGMSTGKKVVAGAAIGVAVPAAVGVAKKLIGDNDDGEEDGGDAGRSRQGGRSTARSSSSSGRRSSSSSRSRSSGTRKRTGSTAKSGGQRKRSRSTSSSSRSSSSSSSGGSRTKEQLYNQAKRLGIEGRSTMTKAQLERAINRARS